MTIVTGLFWIVTIFSCLGAAFTLVDTFARATSAPQQAAGAAIAAALAVIPYCLARATAELNLSWHATTKSTRVVLAVASGLAMLLLSVPVWSRLGAASEDDAQSARRVENPDPSMQAFLRAKAAVLKTNALSELDIKAYEPSSVSSRGLGRYRVAVSTKSGWRFTCDIGITDQVQCSPAQ